MKGAAAMRYVSAKSILTDPYRAGIEIGKALAPISPEVLLLFASTSYEPDFSDFFEALYDALGTTSVIIFGGTGDGIYETSGYGYSLLPGCAGSPILLALNKALIRL